MRYCALIASASFIVSFVTPVFANEAPNFLENKSNFKASGYLDGSYNYLENSSQFISGTEDRFFDINPNGFTLQQAAITLSDQPTQGFGALLNVIAGRDSLKAASYDFHPMSQFNSKYFAFDLTQAYVQYATNHLTVIGGKFVTLVGNEVLDPTQDTNFSRSILWGYAEPTTHTGVRGTYAATDKINLIVGINDGWDNVTDWRRDQTIELGAAYTAKKISFSAQGYTGEERATPFTSTGPIGTRNLIDLIATFNATDQLALIANYDYGWQNKAALPDGSIAHAVWQGIAGYVNYKFTEKWRSSLRGEVFDDQDGYRTGVKQTWDEVTLTLGYAPVKSAEIRAEVRRDFSNVNAFKNSNGITTSNNQQSIAVEGIYKFG